MSFDFYKDAGGTIPFGSETFRMNPAEEKAVFYLSTDAARKAEATSDPGVDDIIFSFDDPSPGSGLEATGLKMAATQGGLAAAPFNNTLNVGTVINGGLANGITIWLTNDSALGTGVALVSNQLIENDI